MDQSKTEEFQTQMKAIIAGEQEAPNKTIGHFAERFSAASTEQAKVSEELKKLELATAEARTNFAKLTGYIEGLAVDLRQLWDEANASDTTQTQTPPA